MTTFVDNINAIRKEKGISTKMLADRADLPIETIQRILDGTTENPRLDTMKRIADALEVELWELFFTGDTSCICTQKELVSLRTERDALLAETAVQKDKIDTLKDKVDSLKDELITALTCAIKQKPNS